MIHQSSLELVGGTPLLQLNNWMRLHGLKANVIAKIEALNPAGSVKDRAARQIVAPTLKMLKKIDKGNGTDYMETIEQQAKLTEKHEMIIRQQTTPAKDLVES